MELLGVLVDLLGDGWSSIYWKIIICKALVNLNRIEEVKGCSPYGTQIFVDLDDLGLVL